MSGNDTEGARPREIRRDRSGRVHGPAAMPEDGVARPVDEQPPRPLPGEGGLVLLGLSIGILLMGIQLWLLALAFDLYLAGERADTVVVALWSGLVFAGGLVMLRFLDRKPRSRG